MKGNFKALVWFLTGAMLLIGAAINAPAQKEKFNRKISGKNRKAKKSPQRAAAKLVKINPPRTYEEREENHEKRQEWFMFQRTFPSGSIPDDARRKAYEARPADADFSGSRFAAPQWRAIGPQPTGSFFPNNWGATSGRINSVAVSPVNPQIVLVGSSTGGVWRSADGGTNFVPVSDNQVDFSVGSIAFSASSPNVVYAGMGDKATNVSYLGTGILKSSDAGASWALVSNNTLPGRGRISQILVDPTNPSRVYVAKYSSNFNDAGGFYVSNDGGVNWMRTFEGQLRDLVQHPTQTGTLYIAVQGIDGDPNSPNGVYNSTNSGATWTRIYTPQVLVSNIKIAVTPAAPQNIYVLAGNTAEARLEVSSNGGASWTNLGTNFDKGQISYNCYLFVHPASPNTIFVGTRDMWRTTNNGANFTNVTNNFSLAGAYNPFESKSHPDQHHFYISPTTPNVIYLANDGGLSKSTDGGATFQSLNATLGLTQFVSLDLHPTDATRSYGGTQDNGTQRRAGNQNWTEFSAGDGGQVSIDPQDNSIVFTTYVNHTINRYDSNGEVPAGEIGNAQTFNNDRVAFYPPMEINQANGTLYFGTYRLYATTNRGANWTPTAGATDLTFGNFDLLSAIAPSRSNPNVIYTGSGQGRVMVSTNGGASFTERIAGLPQRSVTSIRVSPTDANTAYLTVSGFGGGHVFKTTNGGQNWTDISGNLPDVPANDVLISPLGANTLFLATDIGVFRSTTGGNTWETFNMGLPPTVVTELDAQPGGLMQAATYGRGAFEINLNAGSRAAADFDGDGKSDVSVFRPSNGTWYITQSSNNGFNAANFGQNGDQIAPGDYDNDGRTDFAVFRQGNWYILRSSNNAFSGFGFGLTTDKPVAGDYDGDGKTDVAVFRSGNWFIQRSSDNQFRAVQFGTAGDLPTPGDYDGDGKTDTAVFRPSNGTWYVLKSSDNGFIGFQFGQNGDRPVAADYDGDNKTDFAVYRNGSWFVQQTTNGFRAHNFGIATDIPGQGDFDGDGKTDFAVFRPSNGTWYISHNANGAFRAAAFGTNGDVPVTAGYNP